MAGDAAAGNPEAGARKPGLDTEHATLTAAQAAIADDPNLMITLDDGTTVSASEALAQADHDIQQAQIDAKGIEAAATCAMRYGNEI